MQGRLHNKMSARCGLTALAFLGALIGIGPAGAAELLVFERPGCAWCLRFDREIAPIYPKTREGQIAPLRRLDIAAPLPADLAFIKVERLTPLFVLVQNGREIGRIRGYPGEDHFWGLLGVLIDQLGKPDAQPGRAERLDPVVCPARCDS